MKKIRRYKHKMPHFRNTTFNMGQLSPVSCIPVTRGETFRHNTNLFMRVSPLQNPLMHPCHTYIRHYYVPYSIIWDNWREFISGGEDNDDESVHPYVDFTGSAVAAGDLANQLGLPVGFEGVANALPFRAYNLIWNEHYRDDQLQAKKNISLDDGEDTTTDLDMINDNWANDPFMSARPDDQLGTDVTIPLGTSAPVKTASTRTDGFYMTTDGSNNIGVQTAGSLESGSELYTDLSTATGITLVDLAYAIQTGKLQEIINRRGNDYHDFLARYGIKYSDGRLQRPEYLGGGKQTVQFSEVLDTGNNVGHMKGHGIAALRSNRYMSFFEEDGLVISIACVKPIPMYMKSVDKMWYSQTRFDYYQKEYDTLGMQEIENKRVQFDHSSPDGTFGYEPRYEHLRRVPNTVHGDFATLDKDWHYAIDPVGDLALNSSFKTCVPTTRVYQDGAQAQLRVTVQHQLSKLSPIPLHAPPILGTL